MDKKHIFILVFSLLLIVILSLIPIVSAEVDSIDGDLTYYWEGTTDMENISMHHNLTAGGVASHDIGGACLIGGCLDLTNNNDNFTVSSVAGVNLSAENLTLNFWVKLSDYNVAVAHSTPFSIGDGTVLLDVAELAGSNEIVIHRFGRANGNEFRITGNQSLGVWNMYTFVKNGTSRLMYRNGTLLYAGDSADSSVYAGVLHFGSYIGGVYEMEGWIDEIGYWNASLNSSDVTRLWNNGAGRTYGITSSYNQYSSKDSATEGEKITFNLSLTLTNIGTAEALLIYNNKSYLPDTTTKVNANNYFFSHEITIPSDSGNTSGNTINWHWDYNITDTEDASTTVQQQKVYELSIDDCTAYGSPFLNITFREEANNTLLNITSRETAELEIDLTLTSRSNTSIYYDYNHTYYNTTNLQLCIPSGIMNNTDNEYKFDFIAHYFTDYHSEEFHYIDNETISNATIKRTIDLRDLDLDDSTTFVASYTDESNLLVKGAIINVLRKYVGDGVFRIVEAEKTNDDGETLLHLTEEDVVYIFNVSLENKQLFLSEEYRVYCASTTEVCSINLNAEITIPSLPDDWDRIEGGTYYLSADRDTRIVTLAFNNDETATWNLTLYKYSNNESEANTIIGSNQTTLKDGSITLYVPLNYGNASYYGAIYYNGEWIANKFVDLKERGVDYFGQNIGMFMVALIVLTLGLMALSQGVGVIVITILGVIFASISYLLDIGWVTLMYIICAGAIIIWKINRGRG